MQLTDDETDRYTQQFKARIATSIAAWIKANPQADIKKTPWGTICRNAILRCLAWDITYIAFVNTLGDLLTLFYIYWTQYIIKWLIDSSASTRHGVILCTVFTVASVIANLLRNSGMMNGMNMGIKLRKILVSSLYDKLG